MMSHPLAGLTSREAIKRRLIAGLVGIAIGLAAAAILFQAGLWS